MAEGEIFLYASATGATRIRSLAVGGTVSLSKAEVAKLFQATKRDVSLHIGNPLATKESTVLATIKDSMTAQLEGRRKVQRAITYYGDAGASGKLGKPNQKTTKGKAR